MKKIGITAMLIFVNIVAIIFLINFRNNDESEMIVSNTKNHSNDVSIMIQTSAGSTTYTKSTSETWPDSTKYHLNPSKSYCKNGSSYSLSGSKVLVNLNRADDCYFYFDLGATVNFTYEYVHMFNNPAGPPIKANNMTNNPGSDYYNIKLNNSGINISQICITESNNFSNCTWKSIKEDTYDANCLGNSDYCDSYSLKLSAGDGLKTVYAYVKDTSGNVYGPAVDKVTVDTVNPTMSLNITKNGITLNTSDNYAILATWYYKNGIRYTYSNTIPLAIDKYEFFVFDTAGNYVHDAIEIASDSYTVKTKTCKFSTGSYSAYQCPYGFGYYNQNYCIATYGSCGENGYCSIGSCYPNYQGISGNNVCASSAPVGQYCGDNAHTLSNGTCYYDDYHFEETSTTSSTCSVGTSFTCNSSNANKSYVSSCEFNAGCFAGFTKIEGTNYCYKK